MELSTWACSLARNSGGSFERRLPRVFRVRWYCLNWSVWARVRLEYWILLTRDNVAQIAGDLAARAPEIDLEGQRVLAGALRSEVRSRRARKASSMNCA